jgi:predicted  nucleic acid-binding Zn-ribbon protein
MRAIDNNYELTADYMDWSEGDESSGIFGSGAAHFLTYDMWGIPPKAREPRTVMSLTDYLLHSVFSDARTKKLSEPDAANQSMNLLAYRITSMTNAAICYAPVTATDEQYEMPTVDIQEMTSIGVAMAMLILSVMQNEIMLDTQMEAVKGTQNQKLSASQTKILEVQQQIRKSRYKTPLQKFMEWLSSTWVMKFLNSSYGKAIMFLIGAAITIASFGSAGPAVIAISSVLLAFQAAELIMGKSMGELITSGMEDGSAKMALQMSIDIGLMVASMAAGGGGAAKVDQAVDAAVAAKDVIEMGTKATQQLQQTAKAAEQITKIADVAEDIKDVAQNITNVANEAVSASENVVKAADALGDALRNGGSVADITRKTQELRKATDVLADETMKLQTAVKQLGEMTGDLADGATKVAIGNLQQITDGAMKTVKEAQKLGAKAIESAESLTETFKELGKKIDDVSDKLTELNEKKASLTKQLDALEEGADKTELVNQIDDVGKQITDKTDELKALIQKVDLSDAEGSLDTVNRVRKDTQEQLNALSSQIDDVLKGAGDDIAGEAQKSLRQMQEKITDLSRRLEDGTTTLFDAQKEMKEIQSGIKNVEKLEGFTGTTATKEALESLSSQTDDVIKNLDVSGWKAYDVKAPKATRSKNAFTKGLTSAARFAVGIKGLDHLSFSQQVVIALQKFQQRIQAMMQFYQALYSLAMSDEEVRKAICSAEIEIINSKAQARMDFLQMIIDNQMSDIQSLLAYTKDSFARAAEVIREYGDTAQMIARNLVA